MRRELRAYVVKEIPKTQMGISARRASQVLPASDRLLDDVVRWIGGLVVAVHAAVARAHRAAIMASIRSDLERDDQPGGTELLQMIQRAVSETGDEEHPVVVRVDNTPNGPDGQVARRAAELALNLPSESASDFWTLAEALEYFRALAQTNPSRVEEEWPEFIDTVREAYERMEDRMDVLSELVSLRGFTWPVPGVMPIRRHRGSPVS